MRPLALILPALLITSLLAVTPAAADPTTVTITLRVAPVGFVAPSHWATGTPSVWLFDPASDTSLNGAPGIAGCSVDVPDDDGFVTGAQVLDAAAASGCITGWTADDFGFGRFVTSADGVDQVADPIMNLPVLWWWLMVNDHLSPVGIDDMALASGDGFDLVYAAGF